MSASWRFSTRITIARRTQASWARPRCPHTPRASACRKRSTTRSCATHLPFTCGDASRRDTTFSIEGDIFELEQGFLAGRLVTVAYCALDVPLAPWVELEGKRYAAHPVDPERNAHRARPPRRDSPPPPTVHVAFDPPKALLDEACGR